MKEKKAIVEKIYTKKDFGMIPTLLNFQNGSLSVMDKKNTEVCMFAQKDTGVKGMLFATNEHSYHGVIGEDAGTNKLTDMYICVRNKSTNKVRIMPMQEVLLKNTIYNKLETATISDMSKERAQQKLLKEFGGRKAARYVDNKEKMRINMSVVEEDMSKSINDATTIDSDDGNLKTNERNELLLPKINMSAMQLKEVYDVYEIIPKELIETLDEEAKAVYKTPLSELPLESAYLRNIIANVQKSPQSAENFLIIKLIIYMDCLLNLMKSKARSIKYTELSRITSRVEVDVRQRFSDPGKPFTRTAFSKEKATCYFFVLALLISGTFELNIPAISSELGISQARVIKFGQLVGAKKKGNTLNLCLPNEFGSVAAKTAKKRKI